MPQVRSKTIQTLMVVSRLQLRQEMVKDDLVTHTAKMNQTDTVCLAIIAS